MAVDAVAEDMTRAGIELASDMDPDDAERIDATMEEFQSMGRPAAETVKWARLYRGPLPCC